MLLVGQQSTFPKLLFIANRMKIERLIEEGLLLGGAGKADMKGISTTDRDSMHMHGQAMRTSAELSSHTDDDHEPSQKANGHRPASVMEEFRRQSGVFFDDSEMDEVTGESDDDTIVIDHDGHGKTA